MAVIFLASAVLAWIYGRPWWVAVGLFAAAVLCGWVEWEANRSDSRYRRMREQVRERRGR